MKIDGYCTLILFETCHSEIVGMEGTNPPFLGRYKSAFFFSVIVPLDLQYIIHSNINCLFVQFCQFFLDLNFVYRFLQTSRINFVSTVEVNIVGNLTCHTYTFTYEIELRNNNIYRHRKSG
jgi:hypothetical protein